MSRREIALRQFAMTCLMLLAFLLVFGRCTVACLPEVKKEVAAASYESMQMRCVEQYARKADIDRCREKVKREWSTTDAGAEGGDR